MLTDAAQKLGQPKMPGAKCCQTESITEGVGQRARESAISTPHTAHELPNISRFKVVVKGAVSEKP